MAGKLSFGFAAIGVLWCTAAMIYLPRLFLPGDDDMLPVVIPVVLAVLSYAGLHAACHGRRGLSAGWLFAWLLFFYSVISGFSIGMFIMPGALALLLAAAIVPAPR